MSHPKPFGPDEVQAALHQLGLETTIQTFTTSTATSQQAADAIGTSLGSIAKSLCFLVDGQAILIIASGDRQIDDRKLAQLFGVSRKKVKIAGAATTEAVTGFAPGGVSPVGHRTPVPILIDESLARFSTLYAAAGSAATIFALTWEELLRVTGGRVVDVVKSTV